MYKAFENPIYATTMNSNKNLNIFVYICIWSIDSSCILHTMIRASLIKYLEQIFRTTSLNISCECSIIK